MRGFENRMPRFIVDIGPRGNAYSANNGRKRI